MDVPPGSDTRGRQEGRHIRGRSKLFMKYLSWIYGFFPFSPFLALPLHDKVQN
jgi:hypothetical protein